MPNVNIPEADTISFNDFKEGNSIQVRAVVTAAEEQDFNKGKTVTVVHMDHQTKGKIVSDPIVINESTSEGKKTLSLIVEKE